MDFNEDIVGVHGRDILHKAAFVNEALRVIKKLYSKENPNVKITTLDAAGGTLPNALSTAKKMSIEEFFIDRDIFYRNNVFARLPAKYAIDQ